MSFAGTKRWKQCTAVISVALLLHLACGSSLGRGGSRLGVEAVGNMVREGGRAARLLRGSVDEDTEYFEELIEAQGPLTRAYDEAWEDYQSDVSNFETARSVVNATLDKEVRLAADRAAELEDYIAAHQDSIRTQIEVDRTLSEVTESSDTVTQAIRDALDHAYKAEDKAKRKRELLRGNLETFNRYLEGSQRAAGEGESNPHIAGLKADIASYESRLSNVNSYLQKFHAVSVQLSSDMVSLYKDMIKLKGEQAALMGEEIKSLQGASDRLNEIFHKRHGVKHLEKQLVDLTQKVMASRRKTREAGGELRALLNNITIHHENEEIRYFSHLLKDISGLLEFKDIREEVLSDRLLLEGDAETVTKLLAEFNYTTHAIPDKPQQFRDTMATLKGLMESEPRRKLAFPDAVSMKREIEKRESRKKDALNDIVSFKQQLSVEGEERGEIEEKIAASEAEVRAMEEELGDLTDDLDFLLHNRDEGVYPKRLEEASENFLASVRAADADLEEREKLKAIYGQDREEWRERTSKTTLSMASKSQKMASLYEDVSELRAGLVEAERELKKVKEEDGGLSFRRRKVQVQRRNGKRGMKH